jgi:hypothetical protein
MTLWGTGGKGGQETEAEQKMTQVLLPKMREGKKGFQKDENVSSSIQNPLP